MRRRVWVLAIAGFVNASCVAVFAGTIQAGNAMEAADARRKARRSYDANERVLSVARGELKIHPVCEPGNNATCGLLSDDSWAECEAPACRSQECQSRWVTSLTISLGRRYFAADPRRLRAGCDEALPRCADAAALERSFLTAHNAAIDPLIEQVRTANRGRLDAQDQEAMDTFSTKLRRQLAGWRKAARGEPECPAPPEE
jgi:hypothetical protein